MIKKIVIVAAILLGVGFYVWGKDFPNVMKTAGSKASASVKSFFADDIAGAEFDLDRAHHMVKDLKPEIEKCMTKIAEQEVELETLKSDIAARQKRLAEQKKVVLALREALRTDRTQYVFADVPYSKAEVEADLQRRWATYQRGESAMHRDQKILAARAQTLKTNRDKLDEMMVAKEKLSVRIAELEAKLRAVQAAEQVEDMKIDDSQLARTKRLLAKIEKQIAVREKFLAEKARTVGGPGRIPVNTEPKQDVTNAIDVHFGKTPGDALKGGKSL